MKKRMIAKTMTMVENRSSMSRTPTKLPLVNIPQEDENMT
jgi:hypothetical protein